MNRTWTLREIPGRVTRPSIREFADMPDAKVFAEAMRGAPPVTMVSTGMVPNSLARQITVRAFDQTEAAEALLAALGVEPVPCCELGDEPCADCAEAAYDRAQEAREAGYEAGARRETPEELRAQDADRGTLPDR